MCRKPVGEGAKRVTTGSVIRGEGKSAGRRQCSAPSSTKRQRGTLSGRLGSRARIWHKAGPRCGRPDNIMAIAEQAIAEGGRDFIRDIVQADLEAGRHSTVVTRFPPEPNGYLHIGHAKSICLNFGIAEEFGGRCHLRFDDTNPAREEQEYIDAIENDVRWLGFDWGEHLHHASDYFDQLYAWAVHLVETQKAYVDDLSADEIRQHRGTLTEP